MTRSLFPSFSTAGSNRSRQGGVALMVVLILLVLMTLLALVSLRGTLLQERMSSSQYDRSLAFQATEAALRQAEADASAATAIPGAGCDVTPPLSGLCATPIATDTPRWLLDDASWNAIAKPADDAAPGMAVQPSYIIEYMDNTTGLNGNTLLFRVTARAWGQNENTVVTVQSYVESVR